MHLEHGKLVLDKKDCFRCDNGKVPKRIPCTACRGTGCGRCGGKGGCRTCHGSKYVYDEHTVEVCSVCNGHYKDNEPEERSDYAPKEIVKTIPVQITRQEAELSLNEQWLGDGYIFTCSDYGRAWGNKDHAYIVEEIYNHSCQASKICLLDGTLASHILVTIKPYGYTVKAVFQKAQPSSEIVYDGPQVSST